MTWWSGLDDLALAFGWVIGPGLLVGGAWGLRWIWLIGVAPAISIAVISGWAVIAQLVEISFTPLSSALFSCVLAGSLLILKRWFPLPQLHDQPAPKAPLWAGVSGLIISAASAALALKRGMITMDRPPQTWDAVFHLNGARYILETANGSSLTLGGLNHGVATVTETATKAFYPGAWHDLTALATVGGAGGDVVVSANAMAFVIACLLWPVGLLLLTHVLWPDRAVLAFLVPVMATLTVAFPFRLISYGTLWPTAMGYALIPVLMSVAVASRRTTSFRSLIAIIALAVSITCGAMLAHPLAAISTTILLIPWGIRWWWTHSFGSSNSSPRRKAVIGFGVIGAALLAVAAYVTSPYFSGQAAFGREPFGTWFPTMMGVFTDAQLSEEGFGNTDPSWVLLGATVLGVIGLWCRQEHRWYSGSLIIAASLYILSVLVHLPGYGVLAPWYFDPVRLGALVTIIQVPLAGYGLWWLLHRLHLKWQWATVAVLALVLGFTPAGGRLDHRAHQIDINYHITEHSGLNALLTRSEHELLLRLPQTVGEDAVILGSPFTGASLAYATAGVPVIFPHLSGNWPSDLQDFSSPRGTEDPLAFVGDPDEGPAPVCGVVEKYGITHLYTDDLVYWPGHQDRERFEALMLTAEEAERVGLTLVDKATDGARLYEITIC